ncbi:receptor-type tyrosine-protein phosphatase T-like isoform X2 [Biomphalaria glabrata]|uniref:protein-tyrosine-phosphatase n=1 Tax=Biomphalaria glabrata TaxID=6526 RepID=A0A9W3ACE1_BIOGL|nr:receptor-type tyrosine-protein phosphatase T-like isoform X2 [Biomphalaria glabrata]
MADPVVFLVCLIFIAFLGPLPALCSTGCPETFFGWKCKLQCKNCLLGACDPVTGKCNGGCKPGYYGDHCLFEDQYKYDSRGLHYAGHVNKTKDNAVCLKWSDVKWTVNNKTIKFEPDDTPENYCRNPEVPIGGRLSFIWCFTALNGSLGECSLSKKDCPDYLFGEGCKTQCHCRNDSEICNQNGYCKSGCAEGWLGHMCQKKCNLGRFGLQCRSSCDNCLNKDCNPETGHCRSGCLEGFMGNTCRTPCNGTTYGANCNITCGHCLNNEACNSKTGSCPSGCQPGYKTSHGSELTLCNEACRGRYGVNCLTKCGLCQDHEMCDPGTGLCPHGCQDGYTSDKCDQICQPGYYGKDCRFKCGKCKNNSTCDAFTGKCLVGCQDGQDCPYALGIQAEDTNKATVAIGTGLGIAVVVILLFVTFCLIYRNRRQKNVSVSSKFVVNGDDTLPREESCHLLGDSRVGKELPSSVMDDDETKGPNGTTEPIYVNVNARKQTSPVPVSDLFSYISKNKEHSWEGFKREFEELPMGLLAQCEVARKLENKVKNRYGNIVAYDHSRVVLDPLPNEPFSDYVNANFMDGYSKPRAYIASQGPNKIMIRDFWRMVWQHKVSKIIMLTNLMEACKKKCEQYWPDEGSQKYGDITVLHVNVTKYSDFIIRTFEISKVAEMENNRIVKQFHFTTWSDHGAPTYPTTLLAFRRKVMNFKPEDSAPVLSHCSAGIGRTGTFIALNYLLEQAVAENQVDVLRCAQLMRANRVNMIQTLEQYVFVYDAVLEALMAGNTTISRSSFHTVYEKMLISDGGDTSPMEKQQNVLQLLSPTIEREECSTAFQEQNMAKNRFKNILPANRSRPYLYTPVEGCNEYINAVYLSSYTQKDQFIVTQMPLPSTVADFWRMLYDTSSDTIIMLNEFDRNDKTCALYWPEEYGYTVEHGPLSVELLSSSESDPDVTIRIFKLSHFDKGEERAIKQFMFKSWPDYQTVPNSINPLLRLHRLVHDWLKQNSKGPVTVHCMNGASKSGVFVAVSLLLERLELDYEVDVYQTVKQIRINRPQLIENLEQYKFLYQVVQEYMDQE